MTHNNEVRISLGADEEAQVDALVQAGFYRSKEEFLVIAVRKCLLECKGLTEIYKSPADEDVTMTHVPKRLSISKEHRRELPFNF